MPRSSLHSALCIVHSAFSGTAICALLAFILPFLLYLPALRFDLVTLDDPSFISSNPIVTGGLRLSAVRDAFLVPVPAAPMYIPLLWVSYMLDVSIFGNHPWAFHLTNILLHSASSLLLFLFLRRLGRRFSSSLVSRHSSLVSILLSLLWSLHPLRIESVAWAAERKDCLAVFFCLLTLHAWLSALDAPSVPRRLAHGNLSFLFFALGLLSKPSLVPLPLFLPLLCVVPVRYRSRPTSVLLGIAPFLLLAALSSFATSSFHARHTFLPPPPFLSRIATIPSVILFYLSKTLVPRHLSILYPQWTSPLWLGILLALPFLVAAIWLIWHRRTAPFLFLGTAFAALFLLPVSGIVPISYNLVADRYTLLPAIGLSIALLHFFRPSRPPVGSSEADPPPPEPPPRPIKLCILLSAFCLLVAAFAAATARHLPTWRDTDALYLPARRLLPDHFTIRAYDARVARQHGDFATARECAARAYAIFPDYALFLSGVSDANALEGPQAALDLLLAHPPPPHAFSQWSVLAANARLALDRPADALATATRALAAAPPSDAYRNILLQIAMVASYRLGDEPSALAFARQAGVIPPDATTLSPGHFINYYIFLWDSDDRIPALRYYRELAETDPTPSVLNNIAWSIATALWSPSPPAEAVSLARRALDAVPAGSPVRPALLDTLSVALANASDFPAAIDAISSAIALLPSSSPSLPAMRSRLDLYRRSLPYRELLGVPVPPSNYTFDPHL